MPRARCPNAGNDDGVTEESPGELVGDNTLKIASLLEILSRSAALRLCRTHTSSAANKTSPTTPIIIAGLFAELDALDVLSESVLAVELDPVKDEEATGDD